MMDEDEPLLQLYLYKGRPVFRSATKNARSPSPAQVAQRVRVGEAARAARGKSMTGNLPPAAEVVKDQCTGPTGLAKRRKRVWEGELREAADGMMEPDELDEKIELLVAALG